MRWISIVGIVPAALILAAPLSGGAKPAAAGFRLVEIPEGHFRCEVPDEDWFFSREEQEESRMHYYGFYLNGSKEEEGIAPTLSVRYFAPDNTFVAGAEGYLARQFRPSRIKLAGEKTSEPRDVAVAGRPARTFTRDTSRYFPPDSLDTKRVPVREEHYVVPHLGGFIIVRFEAPTASYARHRDALARLLETLRLQPERTVHTLRIAVPGLRPDEVEAKVTNVFEPELKGTPGLVETWSGAFQGESLLSIACKSTADAAGVREEIRRRAASVRSSLPPHADIELGPALPGEGSVLAVTLAMSDGSESRPATIARLTALAERTVRGRIAAVPGVAEAKFTGSSPRYLVVASPERMAEQRIDVRDLVSSVGSEAKRDDGREGATSLDDFLRRTVAIRNGEAVTLGDLAEVRLTTVEPGIGDERSSPGADAAEVRLTVRSACDADPGAVYRAVERALEEVRMTLPEGVRLEHRLTRADAYPCLEAVAIGGKQLLVEVAGPDLTSASEAADLVVDGLRRISGLADLEVRPPARNRIRVSLRRDQAMRYELSDADAAEITGAVDAILERRTVARVNGPHGSPIEAALTAAGDEPSNVGRLTLCTPEGDVIRLASIADISIVEEPTAILHKNGGRMVIVTGRIVGRDRASADREIKAFCGKVRLPEGTTVESMKND